MNANLNPRQRNKSMIMKFAKKNATILDNFVQNAIFT